MGDVMRGAAQLAESDYEEVQMEGRIARLESDVAHIQKDVAEIKADVRSLRDRVDAGFTEIRQSIAQLSVATEKSIGQLSVSMEKAYGKAKVATIETRVWGLVTLGGILLLMARAFKWI
jgi:hypothetical protein